MFNFETDSAVKVSYTIHVKEDDIADFSRNVYQDEEYQKEHEFQVIGLIPDTENTITFYITNEDGSTDTFLRKSYMRWEVCMEKRQYSLIRM